MEVLHVVSDAETPRLQRRELVDFIQGLDLDLKVLIGILSNPHLMKLKGKHLDLWGAPARATEASLERLAKLKEQVNG